MQRERERKDSRGHSPRKEIEPILVFSQWAQNARVSTVDASGVGGNRGNVQQFAPGFEESVQREDFVAVSVVCWRPVPKT